MDEAKLREAAREVLRVIADDPTEFPNRVPQEWFVGQTGCGTDKQVMSKAVAALKRVLFSRPPLQPGPYGYVWPRMEGGK